MTSEGNVGENAQNSKTIINTIYRKPDFPIFKKVVRKFSVNVPIELDTITRVTSHSLSYIHITQRYMHITQAILKCKLSM